MRKKSKAESVGLGAFDAATFGTAPKVSGVLAALIAKGWRPDLFKNQSFKDTYKEGRDYLRQNNQEAFEQNPWSYGAGGLAGALLSPVKGGGSGRLASRTARGSALGALYGLGSSDSGEVGEFEPSNLFDMAKGAGIGGISSAALPPLLRGIGAVGSYVGNKIIPESIKEGVAKGASKLGNLLNVIPQQREALSAFQTPVVSKEANALTNLAKDSPYIEKGSLSAPAIQQIQAQEKVANKIATNAYTQTKSNIGSLDIKQIKQFIPEIKKELVAESIDPSTHQKTYAFMKSFNRILGKEAPKDAVGIDFQRLEGWRKQLNKAIHREPDAAEKYGLNQLKRGYDSFIENNIEKAMLKGDDKILNEYKLAREGWRAYKQQYTAGYKDEYGKKFVQDIINNGKNSKEAYSDEMIANKIFGSSKIGFKPQAINIVNELKNHLGGSSPEFNSLRLEGLNKVIRPLLENADNKAVAINKYNLNLKDSLPVLKALLPESTIKELEYIGQQGHKFFKGNKKLTAESFDQLKYIGTAVKTLNPKNNLISKIYSKSETLNNVIPEGISRSISQALSQKETQPQEAIPQAIETPQQSKPEMDYEALIARMTPEQKARLDLLRQSMQPVQ